MSIAAIVRAVEAQEGKGKKAAKARILTEHKNNRDLREFFRIALAPGIAFGIQNVPTDADIQPGPVVMDVATAMTELYDRVIVKGEMGPNSDALHLFVRVLLEGMGPDDREMLRRLIRKDPNCGVGAKGALDIWPDLYPVYEYCGARPMSKLHECVFPCVAQLKESGTAIYVYCEGGKFTFRTPRTGAEYNFPGYVHDMCAALVGADFRGVLNTEGLILDPNSDQCGPNGMPKTLTEADSNAKIDAAQVASGGELPAGYRVMFSVYDLLPDNARSLPFFGQPNTLSRLGIRNRMFMEAGPAVRSVLHPTVSRICATREELMAWFARCVELGMEGVVAKAFEALWRDGKPWGYWKAKVEDPCTVRCYGVTPHTKHPELVGALRCTLDGKPDFLVDVGTGLDDADRARPWTDYIGKCIDITFHVLSETGLSLKLPRFKGVRPDLATSWTYERLLEEVKRG